LTFDKRALIHITYTAKIKDTEEVFDTTVEKDFDTTPKVSDTTVEKDVKEHPTHGQNVKHVPRLVSVGESWVLKGLDEALANASVGDKLLVEVTPDKGLGERDSGKVRMIPLRKLGEDAEKVSVGDTVDVGNRTGTVRFIGSGRVQIDFNHRHAGKTIVYDVHVLESLDSDDDKISGLLQHHFAVEESQLQFKNNAGSLDITIPGALLHLDDLPSIKRLTQLDMFKFVPSLQKVSFVETYENKAKKGDTPAGDTPKAEEEPE